MRRKRKRRRRRRGIAFSRCSPSWKSFSYSFLLAQLCGHVQGERARSRLDMASDTCGAWARACCQWEHTSSRVGAIYAAFHVHK